MRLKWPQLMKKFTWHHVGTFWVGYSKRIFCLVQSILFFAQNSPFSNVPMQNGRILDTFTPNRSQWPSPEVWVHWDDQHVVRLRFAFQRSLAANPGVSGSRCIYVCMKPKQTQKISRFNWFFVDGFLRKKPLQIITRKRYAFRNSLIFDDHWAHTDWRLRSCFTVKKMKLQLIAPVGSHWVTLISSCSTRVEFDKAFAISRSLLRIPNRRRNGQIRIFWAVPWTLSHQTLSSFIGWAGLGGCSLIFLKGFQGFFRNL